MDLASTQPYGLFPLFFLALPLSISPFFSTYSFFLFYLEAHTNHRTQLLLQPAPFVCIINTIRTYNAIYNLHCLNMYF